VELLQLIALGVGLWEHAARDLSAIMFALTRQNAAQNMVIVEHLQHIVEIHGTLHLLQLEHAVLLERGIEEMETAPIPQNAALSMGSAEFLRPIVHMTVLEMDAIMDVTVMEAQQILLMHAAKGLLVTVPAPIPMNAALGLVIAVLEVHSVITDTCVGNWMPQPTAHFA
jgi:hypothetical protein